MKPNLDLMRASPEQWQRKSLSFTQQIVDTFGLPFKWIWFRSFRKLWRNWANWVCTQVEIHKGTQLIHCFTKIIHTFFLLRWCIAHHKMRIILLEIYNGCLSLKYSAIYIYYPSTWTLVQGKPELQTTKCRYL